MVILVRDDMLHNSHDHVLTLEFESISERLFLADIATLGVNESQRENKSPRFLWGFFTVSLARRQVMPSSIRRGEYGIRTHEGLHPTNFPSWRHRPLGEFS